MIYTVNCTVNFPDDTEYTYRPVTTEDRHKLFNRIEELMDNEPGASSLIFTVTVSHAKNA